MFVRHLTRTTLAAFAIACCALGALVASSAPTRAATPTATATPFASAATTRDNLLALAKTATFKNDDLVGYGVFAVWTPAYPGVSIDGYGIIAAGSNISVYTGSLYPKESENPIAVIFAVKDAGGACALGAAFGSGALTTFKPLTLPAGAACSGNTGIDALRLDQPLATATATPTKTATPAPSAAATTPATATAPATVAAPRPPTTGTGPAPDSASILPLLAAGIVLVLGGSLTLAFRRR